MLHDTQKRDVPGDHARVDGHVSITLVEGASFTSPTVFKQTHQRNLKYLQPFQGEAAAEHMH